MKYGDLVPVGYRSGTTQPGLHENSGEPPFTYIEGVFSVKSVQLCHNFLTLSLGAPLRVGPGRFLTNAGSCRSTRL